MNNFLEGLQIMTTITLDFSSLLKNHFECSFVSSECSLQSSECSLQSSTVCFEVPSEYLRWLNSEQFDWLTYYGSQSELAKLAHRKLSERTSKQTLELCNEHSELCNEHSELTNEHSKWFFKSELKSRVTPRIVYLLTKSKIHQPKYESKKIESNIIILYIFSPYCMNESNVLLSKKYLELVWFKYFILKIMNAPRIELFLISYYCGLLFIIFFQDWLIKR